jgi:transcription elongation factor SPT6
LAISHSKDRETECLDGTRVHPEAYELGRKMVADALDFDEEDVVHIVQNTGRGGVINRLVKGNAHKLNELILEEYAEELERNFNQRKRATLETIRAELQTPYEELRTRFNKMSIEEVFTMLTGETKETLDEHMVAAAKIRRVTDRYVSARLDCGIEGNVIAEEMIPETIEVRPSQGQTVQARIESLSRKTFYTELSLLPDKIQKARRLLIGVPQEEWDDEKKTTKHDWRLDLLNRLERLE